VSDVAESDCLLGELFALFKLALLVGVVHIFLFVSGEDVPTVYFDLFSQQTI